jgi:DNA-binding HxlR family transcriptional regulator
MLGRSYEGQNCSVARTLEVVGERWTLLIIRDVLTGLRRYDEFQQSLGISTNVLSNRLDRLVDNGILTRSQYQDRPPRFEYQLTDRGRELSVPVLALMQWGDRHMPNPNGPPRLVRHAACEGAVTQRHVCESCGPIAGPEIMILPGPGLRPAEDRVTPAR